MTYTRPNPCEAVKTHPLPPPWTQEALAKRIGEMMSDPSGGGQAAVERAYFANPINVGDLTFPHFGKCLRYLDRQDEHGAMPDINTRDYTRVSGGDISSQKRPGNVFAPIYVHNKTNKRILIGNEIAAVKSHADFAHIIGAAHQLFPISIIGVEDNATQDTMETLIPAVTGQYLPIKGLNTGMDKHKLAVGLPSLAVEFEANMWEIWWPSDHDGRCQDKACIQCRMRREFTTHTRQSPGSTCDIVMAIWIALKCARDNLRIGAKLTTGKESSSELARLVRHATEPRPNTQRPESYSRLDDLRHRSW